MCICPHFLLLDNFIEFNQTWENLCVTEGYSKVVFLTSYNDYHKYDRRAVLGSGKNTSTTYVRIVERLVELVTQFGKMISLT
jgi:hypothetical protein